MNKSIQTIEEETLQAALTLERHLQCLQREQRPHRPPRMTADLARASQMAALFRAATPGAAKPDPLFAARLQAQLERILHEGRH